jgi:hypothetical protein
MALTARSSKLLVAGCLLLFGLGACEGYVKRGSTLYTERRYVEAAEVFERTENRLTESTPRQRAEYGLYRGLTLLVLGDLIHAERWLAYAHEIERALPGTLREDHRAELDRGWYALRQRLGTPEFQGPPAPPPAAIAASPLPQAIPAPPASAPAGNATERRSFLPE